MIKKSSNLRKIKRQYVQTNICSLTLLGLFGGMCFSFHWRELFHPFHLPPASHNPESFFFLLPALPSHPHLVTHHCLTKRWQLLTNGLYCLLCISYPRRQWQALGSEEERKRRKGPRITHSHKAPGTGGWKSIQIRLFIGPDSIRAVKCGNHSQQNKMMVGRRQKEGKKGKEEELFHNITMKTDKCSYRENV